MNGDTHITPVDDIREHTDRRDCWCEPELEWPCLACFSHWVEFPDGTKIGHEFANGCPVCGGAGVVTRPNHLRCMVIHDAKDGRE